MWNKCGIENVNLRRGWKMNRTWLSTITGSTLFYTTILLIGYFIFIGFISPAFLSPNNIALELQHAAPIAIVAVGELGTLAIKQMDLSVGGIAEFSGVLVVMFINNGINLPLAILLVLGIGVGIGLINGFIVSVGINSFISTFAVFEILGGLSLVLTKGWPLSANSSFFTFISNFHFLGLSGQAIYAVIITVIGGIIYANFRIGRYIYAVGSNIEAAKISNVDVKKITYLVFSLSGILAAFSGIVSASFLNVAYSDVGSNYALPAIAACVLGGASLFGGKGNPIGAFIGAFLITIITDGLVMTNASPYWHDVVVGFILLFAVSMDLIKRRQY
jgi:ribose transport system permease protein